MECPKEIGLAFPLQGFHIQCLTVANSSARIMCKKGFVGGLGSNPFLSSTWISDKQGFVGRRACNPCLSPIRVDGAWEASLL